MPRIKLRTRTPEQAARELAAGCLPCELAAQAAATSHTDNSEPTGDTGDTGSGTGLAWSGVIGLESTITGDGRVIEPNALRWDTLPIPLRWVREDVGAHDGAVVVGRILSIERKGNQIYATGDFDAGSPDGLEAARQVDQALTNGVSMDLDDVSFEVRVAQDLLAELPGLEAEAAPGDAEEPSVEADEDGRVKVMEVASDDEVMATTDARVRAATLVAVPAFEAARIALDASLDELTAAIGDDPDDEDAADDADEREQRGVIVDSETGDPVLDDAGEEQPCSCDPDADDYDENCDCDADADETDNPATDPDSDGDADGDGRPFAADPDTLTAASIPTAPPAAWFNAPSLSEPTPITVTDDGRIYGHAAVWDTCHTGYSGQCVTPPRSQTAYAYFRTGSVLTKDGAEIPTGTITLDTTHAGKNLTATETLAHYEDTGRGVADVAAGEDAHGIWVAGALRPGVTPEQIRALRASPLSGDWRRIGGNLELVAALAVNVPGFPVPHPQGMVASGVMTSLVASGMMPPAKIVTPGYPGALSLDDIAWLKRLAARERRDAQMSSTGLEDQAAALARRVRASSLAARVRNYAR